MPITSACTPLHLEGGSTNFSPLPHLTQALAGQIQTEIGSQSTLLPSSRLFHF